MDNYLSLLDKILKHGTKVEDRTGTGTLSLFGEKLEFDLQLGFPVITTKKIHLPSVIHELLWFISGETNIKYLNDNNVRIWNEWADENGELGNVYGYQWRNWGGDQLKNVIESIKNNPNSRRHIVSCWNVGELNNMALPPCHMMFQFNVEKLYLDLQLYQRSADMFLGVPFNITSYSLLLSIIAQVTNLTPRRFIHVLGDTHIYLNHIEQVKKQLSRKPYPLPDLWLNKDIKDIDDFTYNDIKMSQYVYHPAIKGKVSI